MSAGNFSKEGDLGVFQQKMLKQPSPPANFALENGEGDLGVSRLKIAQTAKSPSVLEFRL